MYNFKSDENDYLYVQSAGALEEPSQTSKTELLANIAIAWKPFLQKALSWIIGWALNTPLEYQKILYTNVQWKVKTYEKKKSEYCKKGFVSCKSMQKLVWPNS